MPYQTSHLDPYIVRSNSPESKWWGNWELLDVAAAWFPELNMFTGLEVNNIKNDIVTVEQAAIKLAFNHVDIDPLKEYERYRLIQLSGNHWVTAFKVPGDLNKWQYMDSLNYAIPESIRKEVEDIGLHNLQTNGYNCGDFATIPLLLMSKNTLEGHPERAITKESITEFILNATNKKDGSEQDRINDGIAQIRKMNLLMNYIASINQLDSSPTDKDKLAFYQERFDKYLKGFIEHCENEFFLERIYTSLQHQLVLFPEGSQSHLELQRINALVRPKVKNAAQINQKIKPTNIDLKSAIKHAINIKSQDLVEDVSITDEGLLKISINQESWRTLASPIQEHLKITLRLPNLPNDEFLTPEEIPDLLKILQINKFGVYPASYFIESMFNTGKKHDTDFKVLRKALQHEKLNTEFVRNINIIESEFEFELDAYSKETIVTRSTDPSKTFIIEAKKDGIKIKNRDANCLAYLYNALKHDLQEDFQNVTFIKNTLLIPQTIVDHYREGRENTFAVMLSNARDYDKKAIPEFEEKDHTSILSTYFKDIKGITITSTNPFEISSSDKELIGIVFYELNHCIKPFLTHSEESHSMKDNAISFDEHFIHYFAQLIQSGEMDSLKHLVNDKYTKSKPELTSTGQTTPKQKKDKTKKHVRFDLPDENEDLNEKVDKKAQSTKTATLSRVKASTIKAPSAIHPEPKKEPAPQPSLDKIPSTSPTSELNRITHTFNTSTDYKKIGTAQGKIQTFENSEAIYFADDFHNVVHIQEIPPGTIEVDPDQNQITVNNGGNITYKEAIIATLITDKGCINMEAFLKGDDSQLLDKDSKPITEIYFHNEPSEDMAKAIKTIAKTDFGLQVLTLQEQKLQTQRKLSDMQHQAQRDVSNPTSPHTPKKH